jgi:hypothetical protein
MTAAVRPPVPADEDAVLAVVFDAFSSPGRDGSEEVEIVRRTWRRCPPPDRIELVAVAVGAVAGTCWPRRAGWTVGTRRSLGSPR